jgi:hypothetical protein
MKAKNDNHNGGEENGIGGSVMKNGNQSIGIGVSAAAYQLAAKKKAKKAAK